jgi:hypothetical protein
MLTVRAGGKCVVVQGEQTVTRSQVQSGANQQWSKAFHKRSGQLKCPNLSKPNSLAFIFPLLSPFFISCLGLVSVLGQCVPRNTGTELVPKALQVELAHAHDQSYGLWAALRQIFT